MRLLAGIALALALAAGAWAQSRQSAVCYSCYGAPCAINAHCPLGCSCYYGRCAP